MTPILLTLSLLSSENLTTDGAVVVTHQSASESTTENEWLASGDLIFHFKTSDNHLRIYVEGSTTTNNNGVSGMFPRANADAGSALHSDGDGRIQLSEFAYGFRLKEAHAIEFGIVDLTGFFDTSLLMNDETRSFLNTGLGNNPTIPFPDYTLATHYRYTENENTSWRIAYAHGRGLADISQRSYGGLFDDVAADHGPFVIAAYQTKIFNSKLQLGTWRAEHREQSGFYANLDHQRNHHGYSFRWGHTFTKASVVQNFLGVAYAYTHGRWTHSIGATYAEQFDDGNYHDVEVISRFALSNQHQFAASWQRINSDHIWSFRYAWFWRK
ncbi:hypothetical protein LG272_11315 [Pseudidiomarina marina]|uniref:hypothetical protein n=1 Tax=Pseudidiomarina marina TaxID=502366 RepID=UPI00384AFF7A